MAKPSSTATINWHEHDAEDVPAKRVKNYIWDGVDWVRDQGRPSNSSTAAFGNVNVTGAATIIKAANASRKSIVITHETAGETLYIGKDSSVTTSNGIPIEQHQYIGWDDYTGDIYGISDGTTVSARYFEVT